MRGAAVFDFENGEYRNFEFAVGERVKIKDGFNIKDRPNVVAEVLTQYLVSNIGCCYVISFLDDSDCVNFLTIEEKYLERVQEDDV